MEIKKEIKLLSKIKNEVSAKHGILFNAYISGSHLYGWESKDSDIDILVELPNDRSLLDLADIQITLEDSLGKKFDVVTYNSLHPLLRDKILADQILIL